MMTRVVAMHAFTGKIEEHLCRIQDQYLRSVKDSQPSFQLLRVQASEQRVERHHALEAAMKVVRRRVLSPAERSVRLVALLDLPVRFEKYEERASRIGGWLFSELG